MEQEVDWVASSGHFLKKSPKVFVSFVIIVEFEKQVILPVVTQIGMLQQLMSASDIIETVVGKPRSIIKQRRFFVKGTLTETCVPAVSRRTGR